MLKGARRLAVRALTATNTPAWARLANGQRLRVELGSTVGRSIWWRHTYEPEVTAILQRMLREGDVFVDVGANVGYFSILAATLVGSTGEVHAFEPHPRAYALFSRSVVANGLTNVWCHRMALWRDERRLGLVGHADHAFDSVAALAEPGATPVIAASADRLLPCLLGRRPIRLAKVDVEGAELEVLQGMRGLLARDRPTVIVEANSGTLARNGHVIADLFREFGRLDYESRTTNGTLVLTAEAATAAMAGRRDPNLVFGPR